MMIRKFGFPASLEPKLENILGRAGHSLAECDRLAPEVLKISDQFTREEGSKTPWDLPLGYLIYFFPLNLARVQSVLTETLTQFPWEKVTSILDFGSGPGTVHAALEQTKLVPKPILCIENEPRAVRLHQDLGLNRWPVKWDSRWPAKVAPGTLGIFSYSLLEEALVKKKLLELDHLLIISPSTRSQGRELLKLRAELMPKGYSSWAPCVHQEACPMVAESVHDWCHDRVSFDAPAWFERLESHLPMYNHTVTFSYWFASKTEKAFERQNQARVIGDTLFEKGKTRQMICRGPHREFLSWLKREGEPAQIPRGSVVELPAEIIQKGNELRLDPKVPLKSDGIH